MKKIILISVPIALLAACGTGPKKGCKDTGCSAGTACNMTTNACELPGLIGGGGGTTGGGNGGGSGGGSGGGMGGGGGGGMMDAGVDAGPEIDPFDDGGVFMPGDICSYPLVVDLDGGVAADGGTATVVTVSVDLAAQSNQYKAVCNTSTGDGNDVIFAITLTQPQGLIVSATDTSGKNQDAVLALVNSPCPRLQQSACVDGAGEGAVETLSVDRLPAGTWYVLLENYATDSTGDGTYDVQFEVVEPVAGPANDSCAAAQVLSFTNGTATATGTTAGAFNDTGGQPLSCSARSALAGDVFYSFTLTQPQDVTVTTDVPSGSDLQPAVAITNACGVGGTAVQRGCGTGSSFTARAVPAGTYFIVVDGNSADTGAFDLEVTLAPASVVPMNDTCAMPTTLVPSVSQMVDANAGTRDYPPTCAGGASGGDVVYQFTTTMPQKVTVTVTGGPSDDPVISLRGAPCDDELAEIDCRDDGGGGATEVSTVQNLPAGTYYVVVSAYGAANGHFGVELRLEPPPQPPANDTCSTAATLVPNTSQMIDLTAATTDYTFACSSPSGGDAVYTFTTTQDQRVVVTATGVSGGDAVLALRGSPCDTSPELRCADDTGSLDPEVLIHNNLPAGTYYVLISPYSTASEFGIELSLEPPRPPPTNESCTTAPEIVTLTAGTASRLVDLTEATADITSDLCSQSADGADLVYQVTIPPMETLTVMGSPVGIDLDPMIFAGPAVCSMTPVSEVCFNDGFRGEDETLLVTNPTASPKTVIIVIKAYDLSFPGELNVTFTSAP